MKTPVATRPLVIVAATVCHLALAPAAASGQTDAVYRELIARYARGERAPAVAGLARLSDDDMARATAAGEAATLAAQRRREEAPFPLRAAVMLHVDLDEAERPEETGQEQPRRCPGRHAAIAARYARLLARRPETNGFARRFFLAMAHRSQWDACLLDAHRWAQEGLKLFPRDAELLLTAGSALEEYATLWAGVSPDRPALTTRYQEAARRAAAHRRGYYEQARELFADAMAADPELALARVRLGRVRWRLGEHEDAQSALEQAIERSGDAAVLYLAHLFLGRVHEDRGRLELALRHYRLSLAADPQAQAAAIALSHALRLAGEANESRQVLRRALAVAGRRPRDGFWESLVGNALQVDEELAALRRESLS